LTLHLTPRPRPTFNLIIIYYSFLVVQNKRYHVGKIYLINIEKGKKGEASGAQIPRNGKCEVTPEGEGREENLIKTEANTNNMFDIKTKLS
jgi:hypothetical protein